MALSIDWLTYVILVPKTDMTQIQVSPFEVRELDLNAFRLELRDIEDSIAGIPQPATHDHQSESTLAGTTFARQVEILAPYTVTLENGSYAVNAVGANSNVADVLNLNTVQLRTANSAGLIVTAGGGGSGPTALEIADAVWDEPAADHETAGSMGALVKLAMQNALNAFASIWAK